MWPPQPGQSCCAGYSTRSRSGRARADNLAISCLQKQSKHHSLNARASQLCRSSFFGFEKCVAAKIVPGVDNLVSKLPCPVDVVLDRALPVVARPTRELEPVAVGAVSCACISLKFCFGVRIIRVVVNQAL